MEANLAQHRCAIPEWLQAKKNEWLTVSSMSKFLAFNTPRGVLAMLSAVSQLGVSRKAVAHHSKLKYLYLVKEVVARGRGRGWEPIPAPAVALKQPVPEPRPPIHGWARKVRKLEKMLDQAAEDLEKSKQLGRDLFGQLAQIRNPGAEPGVYLMFQGQKCVYVGQSANVAQRVHDRALLVDSVWMIPEVERGSRFTLEERLIRYLEPKGNKTFNQPKGSN
jgi:hypothetical protein